MIVRTKNLKSGVLALLVSSVMHNGVFAGDRTILDQHDGDFRRVAVVGEGYFSVRRVKELFASVEGSARVVVITAFATGQEATMLLGKGHTEADYHSWDQMYYSRHGHEEIRAMELIAIDSNAILKVADKGKQEKVLIHGRDPTRFVSGGHSCEILQLTFHRLPRSIRPDGLNPLTLNVVLKTDTLPSDTEAGDITRALRQLFRNEFIHVDIRTDTWFISDSGFPPWYPYTPEKPPSSKEEYLGRGEVWCSGTDTTVHCTH